VNSGSAALPILGSLNPAGNSICWHHLFSLNYGDVSGDLISKKKRSGGLNRFTAMVIRIHRCNEKFLHSALNKEEMNMPDPCNARKEFTGIALNNCAKQFSFGRKRIFRKLLADVIQ
jgi:hypothetical protein